MAIQRQIPHEYPQLFTRPECLMLPAEEEITRQTLDDVSKKLDRIPRWGLVAFAARSAERVLPFFRTDSHEEGELEFLNLLEAVHHAQTYAGNPNELPSADGHDFHEEHSNALSVARARTERGDLTGAAIATAAASPAVAAAIAVGFSNKDPWGAASSCYYAALAARGSIDFRAVLGAMQQDYEKLVEAAEREGWTDETSVSTDFFDPLWEEDSTAKGPEKPKRDRSSTLRLLGQLQHSDSQERRHAARELWECDVEPDAKFVPFLTAATKDEDVSVRWFTTHILGKMGSKARPAIGSLIARTYDPVWTVIRAAIIALGTIPGSDAVPRLAELAGDYRNHPCCFHALDALRRLGPYAHFAWPIAVKALQYAPDGGLRSMAARVLGEFEDCTPAIIEALQRASKPENEPDGLARKQAKESLDKLVRLRELVAEFSLSNSSVAKDLWQTPHMPSSESPKPAGSTEETREVAQEHFRAIIRPTDVVQDQLRDRLEAIFGKPRASNPQSERAAPRPSEYLSAIEEFYARLQPKLLAEHPDVATPAMAPRVKERADAGILSLMRSVESHLPDAMWRLPDRRLRINWERDDGQATWISLDSQVACPSVRHLVRRGVVGMKDLPEPVVDVLVDQVLQDLRCGQLALPGYNRADSSTPNVTVLEWSRPIPSAQEIQLGLLPLEETEIEEVEASELDRRIILAEQLDENPGLAANLDDAFQDALCQDAVTASATTSDSPAGGRLSQIERLLATIESYTQLTWQEIIDVLAERLRGRYDRAKDPTVRASYEQSLRNLFSWRRSIEDQAG